MMAKKLNHRQARWSLYLAYFDFKLIHRPGCSWESQTLYHEGWTMAMEPLIMRTWSFYDQSS